MYFCPTLNSNEIGDFEVIEHQDKLHVFYLELSSHDSVGHLVSSDGINWDRLPAAIRTGDPDDFDGDQIWTMGVFKKSGTWFMLYTANQKQGLYQVTGLATSKDGIKWTKAKNNPVAKPDPRWYEAIQTGNHRIDWRDPHIIERNGKLHVFLCAREKSGLINNRGCAGYFTSTDGHKWKVQPPACTPRNCFDYECPSVFEMNGKYYMVAIHGAHNRMTYRVANRVEGPYERLYDDSLTPALNASVRPCFWRGKQYLFHWNRGQRDWPGRQQSFAVIASPKLARTTPDGALIVESFDWKCMHAGRAKPVTSKTPAVPSCGDWKWQDDRLRAVGSPGMGIWLTKATWEDFEIEADLQLDGSRGASEFGIAVRTDDTGDRGIFAKCVPGRYTCELVKAVHNARYGPGTYWRGRSVEQSFHFTPSADGRYKLRLIAFGPNIEFNVNGRLVLSHLTLPQRSGRIGLVMEDGRGTFSDVRITKLKAPNTNWTL